MVVLENVHEVTIMIDTWKKLGSWNPFAYVFTILNFDIDSSSWSREIKYIFQAFLSKGMLNVFILFKNNSMPFDMIDIVSWFPYENNNCAKDVGEIVLLDQCKPPLKKYSQAIRIKENHEIDDIVKIPNNFHGCSLNVSSSIWEPFVSYSYSEEPDEKAWSGIEVSILRSIGKHLNLTINFILNSGRRTNRDLDDRNGLYSALVRGFV